jgi:acetoacetate decarboxylase
MKVDPSKYYSMPLIIGPIGDGTHLKVDYPQVEALVFQYLTDPEALAELLPGCYRPTREPLVSVIFSENNGLDFMAGGGYRLATVQVAAAFYGERDHVEGDDILVMFENQTMPILTGRENLGVPKLYADISPIKVMPGGHLRCEAAYLGHFLFGLDIPALKRQNLLVKAIATRQLNARPWLGYKYIHAWDGPPDTDYPTITHNDMHLDKLWMGKKASLRFGTARHEDIGVVKRLMDALATLTILKPVQVLHFTGSAVLRLDLSRRLG